MNDGKPHYKVDTNLVIARVNQIVIYKIQNDSIEQMFEIKLND